MKTKKLGRGAKISLPLLFLLLAALLVAALSGVFGAPGGESAGEASSDAAVSEALPAAADPEGVLILWAIDVGQGDGLLLRMPTGEHVLVDSGVNTDKNAVPDFLREKGVEEIEYAVFTHPHADHIGAAAEVVRGFRVKNVYMPDVAHTSKTYLDLLDALEADESVSVRRAVAGESFSIGEVTFDILSPIEDKYSDLNLYSAVLRVTYREKRFLLMGDAEQPNETALLASGESLRADLLKVGHHGSAGSTGYVFLREVMPDYAVISVGTDNSYGHPTEAALSRLRDADAQVFRTDLQGVIHAVSDGRSVTFETERSATEAQLNPTIHDAAETYIGNVNSQIFHVSTTAVRRRRTPCASPPSGTQWRRATAPIAASTKILPHPRSAALRSCLQGQPLVARLPRSSAVLRLCP